MRTTSTTLDPQFLLLPVLNREKGYPDHGSSSERSMSRHGRSSGSAARLSGHIGLVGGGFFTECGLGTLISSRIVVGGAFTAPSSSRRNNWPRARECLRLNRKVNSSR